MTRIIWKEIRENVSLGTLCFSACCLDLHDRPLLQTAAGRSMHDIGPRHGFGPRLTRACLVDFAVSEAVMAIGVQALNVTNQLP